VVHREPATTDRVGGSTEEGGVVIVIEGGGLVRYVIFLLGCHDVTVLHVELTPTEAALVGELSRMSRAASESDCQPRLSIVKFDETEIDKVVSIDDEQNNVPSPFGDRAGLRLAGGVGQRPVGRPRWLGGSSGVRVEPVGDAVSGVVGEDRPR
jgi:hypothetical protein